MTAFEMILAGCGTVMILSLLSVVVLILRSRDVTTRVVLADFLFYAMLACYLVWTIRNDTSIVYDIALLGAIAAGVLPTVAMARMISRGRR